MGNEAVFLTYIQKSVPSHGGESWELAGAARYWVVAAVLANFAWQFYLLQYCTVE